METPMGLFDSGSKQTSESTTGPLKYQNLALKDLTARATGVMEGRIDKPAFQGPTYAGLTADQRDAFASVRDFANGTAGQLGGSMANAATANLSQAGQAGANAANLFGRLNGDVTGQIAQNAERYMAAMRRDTVRGLTETTLPGITAGAAASGNMNSSKAGAANAIAIRGAQDRMADTSAQIRSALQSEANQMASSNFFNAAGAAGNANGQLISAGALGSQLGGAAMDTTLGAADALQQSGQIQQGDNQGQMTDAYNRWQADDTRQQQVLGDYSNLIARQIWGQKSKGTVETENDASTFGGLAGLAMTGAGMYFGMPPTGLPTTTTPRSPTSSIRTGTPYSQR
jgi:hypothetical protein